MVEQSPMVIYQPAPVYVASTSATTVVGGGSYGPVDGGYAGSLGGQQRPCCGYVWSYHTGTTLQAVAVSTSGTGSPDRLGGGGDVYV